MADVDADAMVDRALDDLRARVLNACRTAGLSRQQLGLFADALRAAGRCRCVPVDTLCGPPGSKRMPPRGGCPEHGPWVSAEPAVPPPPGYADATDRAGRVPQGGSGAPRGAEPVGGQTMREVIGGLPGPMTAVIVVTYNPSDATSVAVAHGPVGAAALQLIRHVAGPPVAEALYDLEVADAMARAAAPIFLNREG